MTLLIKTPDFVIDSLDKLIDVIESGTMRLYTYESYAIAERLIKGFPKTFATFHLLSCTEDDISTVMNRTRDAIRHYPADFLSNNDPDVDSFTARKRLKSH